MTSPESMPDRTPEWLVIAKYETQEDAERVAATVPNAVVWELSTLATMVDVLLEARGR